MSGPDEPVDVTRRRRPAVVLARWVALAAIIYATLLAAWPLVRPAYAAAFRTVGDVTLGAPWPGVRARFQPIDTIEQFETIARRGLADVAIVLRVDRTGRRSIRAIDSRYFGYVPTAVLVALALSTPVSRRRRLTSLAWGLVIVQLLVVLRVLVYLVDAAASPSLQALQPGPVGGRALVAASEVLAQSTLTSFVLPLLVWAAVTVRPGDFDRWFGGGRRPVHSDP